MKDQNMGNGTGLGFVSSDGFFQPIGSLNAQTIEYAGKSLLELEILLMENVEKEAYEKCAVIRDEILKRKKSSSN